MVEDVVGTLGFLCLGSRFRRIAERLQADTQQIIDEMHLPVQAGHYPFLAALDRNGPLTIGDLAQAIGITQPGATRTVGQLLDLGLVDIRPAPDDQRRRVVSLSPKGKELVNHSKEFVWPRIEAAVFEICNDLRGPLLDQLTAIEKGLATAPLARRGSATREEDQ